MAEWNHWHRRQSRGMTMGSVGRTWTPNSHKPAIALCLTSFPRKKLRLTQRMALCEYDYMLGQKPWAPHLPQGRWEMASHSNCIAEHQQACTPWASGKSTCKSSQQKLSTFGLRLAEFWQNLSSTFPRHSWHRKNFSPTHLEWCWLVLSLESWKVSKEFIFCRTQQCTKTQEN